MGSVQTALIAQHFSFSSSDGVHGVHACRWLPEGPPRGVVQLVHGIAEHIGRYDDFARFLAEQGFAVYGHDHLGHGRTASGPEEYGVSAKRGWDWMVQDVRTLRETAGAEFPGVPYFLLGHSMGSFLARTYLIRWPGTVDGCILSGTGQESGSLVALGKGLSSLVAGVRGAGARSKLVTFLSLGAYNRQFRPNRTANDWLSTDPAVVDAYEADPFCGFFPTVGLFRAMMGGLQEIGSPRNLARMDREIPVLFFSGEQDPVGGCGKGVRKVADLFRGAGVQDISVILYPGGRHEMLNGQGRERVFRDVADWLQEKLK
ncbi:MAG: alpha/beta hydrolase [Evtepia sp.]|uniref:alpha/beta hydrolase n=1 Tax=Evtepia sp. TaxID=2773933 RepID=UPI002A7562A5|nr:alpha/beta hydrolase [Evtepia sp.]MDY3014155.1 alpha/beta hydrolase [Evtepia sp.]